MVLLIVVSNILTQTKITYLQVLFTNTLLYLVSLSYCLLPEHGAFCILTVDIMMISSPIVFSILCASNYHVNKCTVWYILLVNSDYFYNQLSIFFLYMISWDISVEVYFLLFSFDLQWYFYFYILVKVSGTFIFSQLINLLFVVFLNTRIS